MTKEQAMKKADKIFSDTDIDFVYLLNTDDEYDIAKDLMDCMFKNPMGYKIIGFIKKGRYENTERT